MSPEEGSLYSTLFLILSVTQCIQPIINLIADSIKRPPPMQKSNLIAADSIKRPPPMQKSNGIHNLPVLHIPEYTPTQSFGGSVHKQRTKKAQIPMPPFTARTSNSSGGHPGKETII